MDLIITLIQDMFLAAIPAVGFALIFNVPQHALKYCAFCGAVGHVFRFFLIKWGIPIEWGTFIAATTISFMGVYWAQKLRYHPKVFTVAAMIPMIPGKFAFTAMLALFEINQHGYTDQLLSTLITSLLKTCFITGALAVGLAMPGLLLYRRRPVV